MRELIDTTTAAMAKVECLICNSSVKCKSACVTWINSTDVCECLSLSIQSMPLPVCHWCVRVMPTGKRSLPLSTLSSVMIHQQPIVSSIRHRFSLNEVCFVFFLFLSTLRSFWLEIQLFAQVSMTCELNKLLLITNETAFPLLDEFEY